MFANEDVRRQAIALAAAGNIGALRQVFDDIYERLGGSSPGAGLDPSPALSDINARLDALEEGTEPPVPLDERIKIAIRALPDDEYGATGKPNVAAIETALGENITAGDRDRVWAAMNEGDA